MILINTSRFLALADSQGRGLAIESPMGRTMFDARRWPSVRYAGSSRDTWLAVAHAEGLAIAEAIVATDSPIGLVPGLIAPHDAKPWTLQPGEATCGRTWRRA